MQKSAFCVARRMEGFQGRRTSVSHSSTDAELLSLDAGLRMDGIHAFDLWDLVIEIFHSPLNQPNKSKDSTVSQGNLS